MRPLQDEIRSFLQELRQDGADELLGPEVRSIEETLVIAEKLLAEKDREGGERYLKLAHLKVALLEKNLFELKVRREEERLARELKEQERLQEEQRKAAAMEKAKEEEAKKQADKSRKEREHVLPSTYTVKRGETLPQIAALPDVYNDASLWPLLYRANRDQIRDPNIIWPGQVLLITRNLHREDIVEAKKYAQDRPLH